MTEHRGDRRSRIESNDYAESRLRVLVVANTEFTPPFLDEREALSEAGTEPRNWIFDVDADLTYLDQRLLTNPSRWRQNVYRRLPFWMVQVLETHRVGKKFDAVFCWSVADVTLVLGSLLRITRRRFPVVTLLTRISEPKKARLLRFAHPSFTRIILPPVTQREFAIRELGVPAEKFVDLPWCVDTTFWQVQDNPAQDVISAAGGEMRDYATLVKAVDGLDIPCHIAGSLESARDWWRGHDQEKHSRLPPNVTIGVMPPLELRELYARSRFVIVPLQATDSDNGITSINEAWSMGRGVICSQVAGQRGVFTSGREGDWVPVGDVEALREAIISLWTDTDRAERMGAAGRDLVTRRKTLKIFSDGLAAALRDACNDPAVVS